MNELLTQSEKIILYQNDEATVAVDVYFVDETFWLSQKLMAELFAVDVRTINEHLQNIYSTAELDETATIRNFRIVQKEGSRQVSREVKFYNLDTIIALGYRVNSKQATQFRRWATSTLTEYIRKGFLLNDAMLKNGKPFGQDYFDELLERIREIRASERRAYQKIADVFEQCSSDYHKDSDETKLFYKTIQNKLHFATTGKTAAEIVHSRVDSEKPYMGLTTWKQAPKGKVLKSDVTIAKNYLNQSEIDKLNRLVVMFIDFAEMRTLNRQIMTMKDWVRNVEIFLNYTDQEILENAGKISRKMAVAKAHEEYEKFRVKQDLEYVSDFDVTFERYLKG